MSAITIRDAVFEDSEFVCLARLLGADGEPILQADIASITCNVFDLDADDPTAIVTSPTVAVSSVISDTLQTDPTWTKDATGYNFKHLVLDTVLSSGGHRYRVEYIFVPTNGSKFPLVFEIKAEKLFSS